MERASALRDQVAIVTGGGRGVGRAIADALADSGAAVALAARSEAEVGSVAAAIKERGGRALAHPADVTDERAVADLVATVAARLGPPALLVNAAGTWTEVGPVERADPEAWWRDVEVSLKGTFLCSRAVVPSMTSQGRGRIVNVASHAGVRPRPYATAYASAKAAVLRFTDSFAAELEGRGVHVFAISPGFVRTRLIDELAASEGGRTYLPQLATRGDAVEPERAGRLVVEIATGRLDPLAGRYLHVLDDVDDLLRRSTEIGERDLYTLRLRS
jgi:NAD(P)-dependent dehydrogenase (short-subunit alcohol dehydrogenase family)